MKGQYILASTLLLMLLPSFGIIPLGLQAQAITGISPDPACVGDTLTITGLDLENVVGGKIGDTQVSLVPNSSTDTGFKIVIPAGLEFRNDLPTNFMVRARIPSQQNPFFADSVLISPEISLTVSFDSGQTANICEGSAIDMTVESDPPDPESGDFAYSYLWSPTASLSASDQVTVTATPSSTTAYTVEVSAGEGCAYIETVEIEVRREPILDSVRVLSNPCEDEKGEIKIFANGNADLEFQLIPSNGNDFSDDPVFSNLDDGTYDVQIRYQGEPKCETIIEEAFTLNSSTGTSLTASIIEPVETDSFCVGDILTLRSDIDPTVISYTWSLGPDGQADTLGGTGPIDAKFMSIGEQDITLTVSDGTCTVSDSVTIFVDGFETDLDINKDQSQICQGDQVMFSTNPPEGSVLTWDFGSAASPVMATGSGPHAVAFQMAGIQPIRLTIAQGGGECPAIVQDSIIIDSLPSITVLPAIPTHVMNGDTVALTVQSAVESVLFQWEITLGTGLDSLSNLIGEESMIRQAFTLSGEADAEVQYLITALAENGCIDSLQFSFTVSNEVLPSDFSAADVFTPNGDGYNDTWSVELPSDLFASEHVLLIFNRSGGLIFEEDASGLWDGRNFRNGQPAPAGPYWYVISHKENRGKALWSGAVTLIR